MKIFTVLSIAFVCIVATSFWGCQKEDLGNIDDIFSDTTQTGPVAEMTARINNVPWSATSYDITLTPGNPGQIEITGQSNNGQTITLFVSNSNTGDYLMTKLATQGSYAPDSTGATVYKSNASSTTGGVISIDTIDTTNQVMTGEFNFIGGLTSGSTASITDGMFINLGYTNTASNVEFSANVNGKSWIPSKVTVADPTSTNILTITADKGNGQKMTLSFPATIKERKIAYPLTSGGTYAASFLDAGYTLVPDESSTHNTNPKMSCSIRITSNSTASTPRNIKGTFNFYAVPTSDTSANGSRIAAGTFNVNY